MIKSWIREAIFYMVHFPKLPTMVNLNNRSIRGLMSDSIEILEIVVIAMCPFATWRNLLPKAVFGGCPSSPVARFLHIHVHDVFALVMADQKRQKKAFVWPCLAWCLRFWWSHHFFWQRFYRPQPHLRLVYVSEGSPEQKNFKLNLYWRCVFEFVRLIERINPTHNATRPPRRHHISIVDQLIPPRQQISGFSTLPKLHEMMEVLWLRVWRSGSPPSKGPSCGSE